MRTSSWAFAVFVVEMGEGQSIPYNPSIFPQTKWPRRCGGASGVFMVEMGEEARLKSALGLFSLC